MNQIASLRQRSHLWYANYTARQRCAAVGRVRHEIVQQADKLIAAAKSPQRTNDKETLAAELIPLCDALRWIAGKGPRLLADRTPRWWSRPLWLWGTRPRVRRVPHGVVLILGTWNYSMLLAGVQAAQAIAAGNAVLWKPAPGCESATRMLIDCFLRSLPNDTETPLIQMLPSDASAAVDAMRQSVDMVVLTGGYDTGRAVLKQSVDSMTPCLLELSGCDAMIVVPNAPTRKTGSDQRNRNYLDRVADHAVNALTLNSGATCIGPRRMLVHRDLSDELLSRISDRLKGRHDCVVHPAARTNLEPLLASALGQGATDPLGRLSRDTFDSDAFLQDGRMPPTVLTNVPQDHPLRRADVFAPLACWVIVQDAEDAVRIANDCPYGLAASVFGDASRCRQIADQLMVGTVTINDMIVPTADPRLPFGGRKHSGYGVTRGAEGLLAMTAIQTQVVRKPGTELHLQDHPQDAALLHAAMRQNHSRTLWQRLAALRDLIAVVRRR